MSRGFTLHKRSSRLYRLSKISVLRRHLHASDFNVLKKVLTSRRLPLLCDPGSPVPSILLSTTLSDFLPPHTSYRVGLTVEELAASHGDRLCSPGYHLVYFPPAVPLSSLLPDGTDPAQSPGGPFVRRMWAGGKMDFTEVLLLGRPGYTTFCAERIRNVSIKGLEGQEKIFVTIERRMMNLDMSNAGTSLRYNTKWISSMVEKTGKVMENRTLVFMRQRNLKDITEFALPEKTIKPPHEPTFSHTLTPTAALLFRFSALTYNAHAIHLDKEYCRTVEGHRNLLVHGPLSLVLMLRVLGAHFAENVRRNAWRSEMEGEHVTGIEYRNLAPLYAEEEMKICGRKRKEGEYDIWIEGRNGGYAVKGLAMTRRSIKGPRSSTHFRPTIYKRLKYVGSAATHGEEAEAFQKDMNNDGLGSLTSKIISPSMN